MGGAVGDHQAAPGERRSTFGRDQLFFNSAVHQSLALLWPGKLLMINPTLSSKMMKSDGDADGREKYWLLRFTVGSLSVTKL